MNGALARGLGFAALALFAQHLYGFYTDFHRDDETISTRQSLRRLAALTVGHFPDRQLGSAEEFWKAIGRGGNPMRDRWGQEFRLQVLEERGQHAYAWSSAGPDGVWATRDDITVPVPYPKGGGALPPPDIGTPEEGPSSRGAQ